MFIPLRLLESYAIFSSVPRDLWPHYRRPLSFFNEALIGLSTALSSCQLPARMCVSGSKPNLRFTYLNIIESNSVAKCYLALSVFTQQTLSCLMACTQILNMGFVSVPYHVITAWDSKVLLEGLYPWCVTTCTILKVFSTICSVD